MNRIDLVNYRNGTPYIKQLEEDIQMRIERLTKITPAYKENFGGMVAFDKIGEGVAELIDQEELLLDAVKKRMIERKRVAEAVESMPNDKYQKTILYFRYIAETPKTLTQIAEMLPRNYDYKYVCKLHGIALDEFDRKYDTKTEITFYADGEVIGKSEE